jgi:hypothetical protein
MQPEDVKAGEAKLARKRREAVNDARKAEREEKVE